MFWGSVIAYGWLTQYRVHLTAPLIFQFLSERASPCSVSMMIAGADIQVVGYSVQAILQLAQVLLVDMFPGKGASVTANVSWFSVF